MKRVLSRVLPALAVGLWAFSASAQYTGTLVQSPSLGVSATVAKTCSTPTITSISGALDPLSTAAQSLSGNISVSCTKGVDVYVVANAGANGSAVSGFTRAVSNGAATPEYIGYTLSMTNSTPASVTLTPASQFLWGKSTGKTAPVVIPVTAAFDTNANPSAGTYTDTVTVDIYVN